MSKETKITPFLWYNDQLEDAINFYPTVFKNTQIKSVNKMDGRVFSATFVIEGQEFMALNGGPHFSFTPAISLFVKCETQEEVDHYWNKLTADGGKESRCGWLEDKYGLSWQIIPNILMGLLYDKDASKANRVMQAMMQMAKIDIATLEAAAAQK